MTEYVNKRYNRQVVEVLFEDEAVVFYRLVSDWDKPRKYWQYNMMGPKKFRREFIKQVEN